jgi:hypothetical protein
MIEYFHNLDEGRREFIYVKDGKYCAAHLLDKYSEEEKIKFLTGWFNAILRL